MKRKNIFFGTFQYHFTHINIHTKRKRKQQQQQRENQIKQGKQEKQDKQIIETPSTDLGSLLLLQLLRPSGASENSPMHPLQVLFSEAADGRYSCRRRSDPRSVDGVSIMCLSCFSCFPCSI